MSFVSDCGSRCDSVPDKTVLLEKLSSVIPSAASGQSLNARARPSSVPPVPSHWTLKTSPAAGGTLQERSAGSVPGS